MLAATADFPGFPTVDVAALHETAAGLRRLVAGLDDAAATVRAVASSVYGPVWNGSAADAWAEHAAAVYADLHRGGPLLTEAARAADRLADGVSDAHAAYTRAREDYGTAVTSRDAAASAVAAGAVQAAAAVTAGGQAMADAATAAGRAGDLAAAAGDTAARVFTACADVADSVGHFPSAERSRAHLTPAWSRPGYNGVHATWTNVTLAAGISLLQGNGGNGEGDDGGEPGGGRRVYVGGIDQPKYGDWEGPDGAYGHGGYIPGDEPTDESAAEAQQATDSTAEELTDTSVQMPHHEDVSQGPEAPWVEEILDGLEPGLSLGVWTVSSEQELQQVFEQTRRPSPGRTTAAPPTDD